MQGLLKVKDIRGGIPFLIAPPLYLFHLKEAPLPSHFSPLIHHPLYPPRTRPAFPHLISSWGSATVFQSLTPALCCWYLRAAVPSICTPLLPMPPQLSCSCFFPHFTSSTGMSHQFGSPKLEATY